MAGWAGWAGCAACASVACLGSGGSAFMMLTGGIEADEGKLYLLPNGVLDGAVDFEHAGDRRLFLGRGY